MDRNEILEKARTEAKDEGKEYVDNQGRFITDIIFFVMFLIIFVINFIYGVNNYLLILLAFTYTLGECIAKYRFYKKKTYIFGMIASAFVMVCNLVLYIADLNGLHDPLKWIVMNYIL